MTLFRNPCENPTAETVGVYILPAAVLVSSYDLNGKP